MDKSNTDQDGYLKLLAELRGMRDGYLTRKQLAARWSKCTATVANMEKKGLITRIHGIPGHPRYRLQDIEALETSGEINTETKGDS